MITKKMYEKAKNLKAIQSMDYIRAYCEDVRCSQCVFLDKHGDCIFEGYMGSPYVWDMIHREDDE